MGEGESNYALAPDMWYISFHAPVIQLEHEGHGLRV